MTAVKRKKAFRVWLNEVAAGALRVEWIIDPDPKFWFEKYKRNLSPDQALEELWSEVNQEAGA